MVYEIDRTRAARSDLEHIFAHLFRAHLDFGEDRGSAFMRAARTVTKIDHAIDGLGDVPRQGTHRTDLGEGPRMMTKGRAILYLRVDERARQVSMLAIFFGGQDHGTRMLSRLGAIGFPAPSAP
ncbi:MAG: type II toxin-antitoxin system RelE/ParE family toxin [Pseudomonadota bacterium]